MGGLSRKYCIVGVGESAYIRGSGVTPLTQGGEALRNAILDAGLEPRDLDGLVGYTENLSCDSRRLAGNLGFRLNFHMDGRGGGAAAEAQVAAAIGVMEVGNANCVAVWRANNGYSQIRLGHSGFRAGLPIFGTFSNNGMLSSNPIERPYGYQTPLQEIALAAMDHMKRYGTTPTQLAQVKVAHSKHASNNPKAIYKKRVTVEDVLNSRWVVKPFHLLDCCVETDGAAAIVITSAERAWTLRRPPVYILGVAGRTCSHRSDRSFARGPISTVGQAEASKIAFKMAGISLEDVHLTAAADVTTWTTLVLLEEAGYCKKGEGGDYVSSGIIELGGARPNNTSGGYLCEAYTDGMQLIIENVRQLRWQADDSCPRGMRDSDPALHTYDYSEGKCRQVKAPYIAHNIGWSTLGVTSSLILSRVAKLG